MREYKVSAFLDFTEDFIKREEHWTDEDWETYIFDYVLGFLDVSYEEIKEKAQSERQLH